jgi:hypothetical protein
MSYKIGDSVFWVLRSTSGDGYFIGHRKTGGDKILILATSAEVGVEIDAENCRPTGRAYPDTGREYRLRYARNFPGKLLGAS